MNTIVEDLQMTESFPKRNTGDVSRRMKILVGLMLLMIVLPPAITNLPVSKMVVIIVNVSDEPISMINVYHDGYGDDVYSVDTIMPGSRHKGSFDVEPGEHSVRIIYHVAYAENSYNVYEMWGYYDLAPFETDSHTFELPQFYYY